MGYGRQGRGGGTSRQESIDNSKEKRESKPAETDVSADEIRKMVAKFLKELACNTNPRKAPCLLNQISEEKTRALGFMSKLKHVTDPSFCGRDRPQEPLLLVQERQSQGCSLAYKTVGIQFRSAPYCRN